MACVLNGILVETFKSENNTLFVESYKEVFFDIYQIVIDGNTFIAELVETTQYGPLVKVKEITHQGYVYNDMQFLVIVSKHKQCIGINPSLLSEGVCKPIPALVYESISTVPEIIKEIKEVKIDTRTQAYIAKLKEQALVEIDDEKTKLTLIKEEIKTANNEVNVRLEEYKQELLKQFYSIVEANRDTFNTEAEKKLTTLVDSVQEASKKTIVSETTLAVQQHVEKVSQLFNDGKATLLEALASKVVEDIATTSEVLADKVEVSLQSFSKEQITQRDEKEKQINEFVKSEIQHANVNLATALTTYKASLIEKFEDILKATNVNLLEANAEVLNSHEKMLAAQYDASIKKSAEEQVTNTEALKIVFESATVDFKQTVEAKVYDVTQSLQESIHGLYKTKKAEIDAKLTELDTVTQRVDTRLDELKEAIDAYSQDISTKLFETFESKFNTSSRHIDGLYASKKDEINTKIEKLNSVAVYVDNTIGELRTTIEEQAQKTNTELTEQINTSIQNVTEISKNDVNQRIEVLKSEIANHLKQITIESVVQQFSQAYEPKIDTVIADMFSEKAGNVLLEKFDIFKNKGVTQKFDQMVSTQFDKKESALLTKVRKMIMDFYYSYGTGGGAGNVTITTGSSGSSGGPSPFQVFSVSGLTSMTAVIDSFPLSSFRTAKYNIEVNSGNDVYSSEISVAGNAFVGKSTEYAILYTSNEPYITYNVISTGTTLQLIISATPSLTNMVLNGVRLDPLLT